MICQALSRYTRQGASSRVRMGQFDPCLKAAGILVKEQAFFGNGYLDALYGGRGKVGAALNAYRNRMQHLLEAQSSDVIWLEKEAFPFLPWPVEKRLWPQGTPVVSDFDDALFHRYDRHGNRFVRQLLGNKIAGVMATSKIVLAGNGYLADHAHAAGAARVEIVPTVVDTEIYKLKHTHATDGQTRIGWIGSPSTWTEFGSSLVELVLSCLTPVGGVFRVVGGGQAAIVHSGIEALDWAEDKEVDLIRGMDIGIMPLADTPWARGKCGYKLIQYMACGLPVIASPVGVNCEIVEHGVNGFLADTDDEWRDAFNTLLRDPGARRQMGAEGRKKVERSYSLQVWGPRVAELLCEAAG